MIHEAWCPSCSEPFDVSEADAVAERLVTCPHCKTQCTAHWEESPLDFQMGVVLEIA